LKIKLIVILIVCIFVAYGAGFVHGSSTTIKIVAQLAAKYFDLDQEAIEDILINYRNRVSSTEKIALPEFNITEKYLNDTGL